jgi:hypothetical protein
MRQQIRTLLPGVLLLCAGVGLPAGAASAEIELGRGHRWVRSHPFSLTSLVLTPESFDAKLYAACNLNAALLWKAENELFIEAVRGGLPWHGHAKSRRFYGNEGAHRFDEGMQGRMKQLVDDYPGCEGWLVWDEPERDEIELAGKIAAWVRKTWPDQLVYTDANPGGHEEYRGEEPRDGYSYGQYLRDITGTIKPDVLMVDFYPFFEEPYGDRLPYYRFLCEHVRTAALEANVPYWMFIQAYSEAIPGNNNNRRYPSESDVRLQVFTTLSYGFTGFGYFIYSPAFARSILNEDGTPTRLYYDIARVNLEVLHLGQTLRYLRSTDVRVVTGRHKNNGHLVPNEAGPHDTLWQTDAGRDYGIRNITVDDHGAGQDGLVGLFRDDDGQPYFMLVNLSHGAGSLAADKRTTFTIELMPGIEEIKRLSRETGEVELLHAPNGKLRVTLPGGTGDLFTTGQHPFPGLEG